MKSFLLPALFACGTLLPFTAAQAAETFGGFLPGKTFRLTVTERTSTKTKGTVVTKDVAIPDSIPKYAVGEEVRFRIGSNGQLTTSDFSIAYRKEEGLVNFYANKPTLSHPTGRAATVTKNSSDRPLTATLTFYKIRFSGFIPVTYTVNYVLER